MCGIVGYVGEAECANLLVDGLRKLEYRGYDSAGVAVLGDKGLSVVRAKGKLSNLRGRLDGGELPQGTMGIGHTRWATHGKPSDENAHPHKYGGVAVVHNGIIENHMELKEQLQKAGHKFTSETDTEIFAHLIHVHLTEGKKSLPDAVRASLGQVRGTYALAVMSEQHPGTLVCAKNASPLVVGLGEKCNFIASDVPAILAHTRNVIYLEEGDFAVITQDKVILTDAKGATRHQDVRRIDWTPTMAEKVVACGTSWHASLTGKLMIETIARIPVEVDLASEYRYREPLVDKNTLCIAVSQSGETADTLGSYREARLRGARGLAICNVVGSAIARESDDVLYTHAGPEIGVASTKAFTTQLAAFFMLAVRLGRLRGTLTAEAAREHLKHLNELPLLVERVLKYEDLIKVAAYKFSQARAEGYAAGEMKHGPIALIDENMPVMVMAPRDSAEHAGVNYEKILGNMQEVKARGGRIIAIHSEGDEMVPKLAEVSIPVPQTNPLLMPIISVIPTQLFSYHVADHRGTDVDQPRNLAKSVTVE